jgi:putative hydrolase of the HAD superfamily
MSRSARAEIPFAEIDTVFFDVGNTLVSIDFDWVSEELAARGVAATPVEIRRAEAAARPRVSAGLATREQKETLDAFRFYLGLVLGQLAAGRALGEAGLADLVRELAPVLRAPGRTQRLWSWLLPGVSEALRAMGEAGLQLAVVSNSDGSAERSLIDRGLRDHFHHVTDSHLVGHEKPDPRIFEHTLAACGADPARTLHVGDLYAADVVGARAAGVHPVLLDPFDDWGDVDCVRLPDITALGERLLASRNPAKRR